jgi:RecB family exonuclease
MVRGSYAHEVLQRTYSRLRDETGSRRITAENLGRAEELMRDALDECQALFQLSPRQTRVRAAVRRLEFDLLRYLRWEAEYDGDFEPRELEFDFDGVELQPGVSIRGRIDRVDEWNGHALVRDYKSGRSVYPVARWEQDNRLQAALYMLAAQEELGLEPAGGVYVPLAGEDRRARGLVRADLARELGSEFLSTDQKDEEEFERQLQLARGRISELVGDIRAGKVKPCPGSCSWRDQGCSYPSICRLEGGANGR